MTGPQFLSDGADEASKSMAFREDEEAPEQYTDTEARRFGGPVTSWGVLQEELEHARLPPRGPHSLRARAGLLQRPLLLLLCALT